MHTEIFWFVIYIYRVKTFQRAFELPICFCLSLVCFLSLFFFLKAIDNIPIYRIHFWLCLMLLFIPLHSVRLLILMRQVEIAYSSTSCTVFSMGRTVYTPWPGRKFPQPLFPDTAMVGIHLQWCTWSSIYSQCHSSTEV